MKAKSRRVNAWLFAALGATVIMKTAICREAMAPASVAIAADATTAPGEMTASSAVTTPGGVPAASEDGNAPSLAQEKDKAFVVKASQAGREEVAAAREAVRFARREETRQLASLLQQDHQTASAHLQAIVQSKGWIIPEAKARSESPPASDPFSDEQYLGRQLAAHDKAIGLFKDEASAGADPDLRQFASLTMVTLQKHRSMLESLLARVQVSKAP